MQSVKHFFPIWEILIKNHIFVSENIGKINVKGFLGAKR
jgi:hypothetical protein